MSWREIAIILIAGYAVLARAETQKEPESGVEMERARIDAARRAVEQRMAADEADCHRKFAVNDCLSAARSQRRGALADLRRQEVALNDGQRRMAAARRQQQLDEKSAAIAIPAGSDDNTRPDRVRTERSANKAQTGEKARRDDFVPNRLEAPDANTVELNRVNSSAQRAADAARRAEQARARVVEARERQSNAEKRSSEQGKTASPLPTPP